MKYLHFSLVVLLSLSGVIVHAGGDPVAGKTKAEPCAACHAADGNSVMPDWPKLAGQSAKYIEQQLAAFKSGDRKNALMAPMATGLSEHILFT
jgi:cytochrome c553